jgi:6-phosphogluconate dehydrogenase
MGQNLVLNMNDHGFRVAVYNRTTVSKVDEFLANSARGTNGSSARTRWRSWSGRSRSRAG